MVDKTKELEKHVYDAPRPHSSWREFVLVLICSVAVRVALQQLGKKLVLPYVLEYLSEKTQDQRKPIKTISEQVDDNNSNRYKLSVR